MGIPRGSVKPRNISRSASAALDLNFSFMFWILQEWCNRKQSSVAAPFGRAARLGDKPANALAPFYSREMSWHWRL